MTLVHIVMLGRWQHVFDPAARVNDDFRFFLQIVRK